MLSTEKTEFKREIGVFGGVSIIGGPGSVAAVALALMEVLRSFFAISTFGVKIASAVQSVSMVAKLIPVAIILLVERILADGRSITVDLRAKTADEPSKSVFTELTTRHEKETPAFRLKLL